MYQIVKYSLENLRLLLRNCIVVTQNWYLTHSFPSVSEQLLDYPFETEITLHNLTQDCCNSFYNLNFTLSSRIYQWINYKKRQLRVIKQHYKYVTRFIFKIFIILDLKYIF